MRHGSNKSTTNRTNRAYVYVLAKAFVTACYQSGVIDLATDKPISSIRATVTYTVMSHWLTNAVAHGRSLKRPGAYSVTVASVWRGGATIGRRTLDREVTGSIPVGA